MRVFLLASGCDTAGQLAAIRAALSRERPQWRVDQMRRIAKWIDYPRQYDWRPGLARKLWAAADVVHLCQSLRPLARFGAKPCVVHHHGSEYRLPEDRARIDAACRAAGTVQVVATLDLLGSPGVEWLPAVAHLDGLAQMRAATPPHEGIVIAHSPTQPAIKGTAAIELAVARIKAMGYPVTLDVITGVPWSECLARKARADIFVDQLELGYGLSAVEAWGMGLPVVVGVADQAVRRRMADMWDALPFVEASPDTLVDALLPLVTDATLRVYWGQRGAAHAARFHSEAAIAERLERLYGRALGATA